MDNKPLLVSIGIIARNNEVLISQRKPTSFLNANEWELPGGKVEFTEDPQTTVVREILEELDVETKVERIFDIHSRVAEKDGKTAHFVLLVYLVRYVSGNAYAKDTQSCAWITAKDLDKYQWIEEDKELLQRYFSELELKNN